MRATISCGCGVVIALMFAATVPAGGQVGGTSDTLYTLASWLAGSFSSEGQARQEGGYIDIRLRMVPIWEDRTDAYWLYVEQATAAAQDKPYRQRVYRLTSRGASTFESAVYTIPQPGRFAGAWQEEKPLRALTPDSLLLRTGCSILLKWDGADAFVGSTSGRECPSDLRGAAYATSEVRVTAVHLVSWDRGWNSEGVQVWGASRGGYVFTKLESYVIGRRSLR